jgi:hypothetical protein
VIDLYVTTQRVGWASDGAIQGWIEDADIARAVDRCCGNVRTLTGSPWRRPRVRAWLSGALSRPFLVGPLSGVAHWSDVQAIAEATAARATNLEGAARVVLERHWPDERAVVATAAPRALLGALEEATRRHRLSLRSVRPLWARALDQTLTHRPEVQLLVVDEADAWTVLSMDGEIAGSGGDLRLATHAAPSDREAAEAFRGRLLMSHDVARERAMNVMPLFDAASGSQAWPSLEGSMWEAAK